LYTTADAIGKGGLQIPTGGVKPHSCKTKFEPMDRLIAVLLSERMMIKTSWMRALVISVVAVGSGFVGGAAFGADVSMVSGLYRSEEWKAGGRDAGGKSEIAFAGRYHDDLSTHVGWFAMAGLNFKSYDAADGGTAPDNSTGIGLGGGMRLYFSPFGHSAVPYVAGSARYMNDKDTSYDGDAGGFREETTSGLFYSGAVGLRIGLNEDFFMELESQFFDSALYATVKTERTSTTTTGGTPTTTKTDEETTRTELFADTGGAVLGRATFALGMKL